LGLIRELLQWVAFLYRRGQGSVGALHHGAVRDGLVAVCTGLVAAHCCNQFGQRGAHVGAVWHVVVVH
jgi:hypothetical protein